MASSYNLAQASVDYHDERFHQSRLIFSKLLAQQQQQQQQDQQQQQQHGNHPPVTTSKSSSSTSTLSSKKRPRPLPILPPSKRNSPSSSSFSSSNSDDDEFDEISNLSQTIFAAVPRASLTADEAMCRLRSALSSPRTASTTTDPNDPHRCDDIDSLLHQARETNRDYRRVLDGVVSSLQHDAYQRHVVTNNEETSRCYAVSRYRRQTALAVLMAGVAASWLYLHRRRCRSGRDGGDGDVVDGYDVCREDGGCEDGCRARSVLTRAICTAASCFCVPYEDGGGGGRILSWEEGLETVRCLLSSGKRRRRGRGGWFGHGCQEERQRIEYVLETLDNALCVVHLAEPSGTDTYDPYRHTATFRNPRLALDDGNGSDEEVGGSAGSDEDVAMEGCREDEEEDDTQSNETDDYDYDDDDDGGSGDPQLTTRTNLILAIWHHTRLTTTASSLPSSNYPDNHEENEKATMIPSKVQGWSALSKQSGSTTSTRMMNHREMRDRYLHRSTGRDDVSGLSHRVQVLLQGFDLLYWNVRNEGRPRCDAADGDDDQVVVHRKKRRVEITAMIASLEKNGGGDGGLNRSLVGCYYASDGRFSEALESFRKALDILEEEKDDDWNGIVCGGYGGGCGLYHANHRVTISNIAQCFAMLGNHTAAVELLLYLLTPQQKSNSNTSNRNNTILPSTQNLTSPYQHQQTTQQTQQRHKRRKGSPLTKIQHPNQRNSLLWRLFHAASLGDDRDLCRNVAQRIESYSSDGQYNRHQRVSTDALLAKVFSMLQLKDWRGVLDVLCQGWKDVERSECGGLAAVGPFCAVFGIGVDLYVADARVQKGGGLLFGVSKDDDDDDDDDDEHDGGALAACDVSKEIAELKVLMERTCSATEALCSSSPSSSPSSSLSSSPSREICLIRACSMNNYGITLAMGGEVGLAMSCFLEACRTLTPILITEYDRGGVGSMTPEQSDSAEISISLHSFFNLSVLLLRGGFIIEAADLWLKLRGFGSSRDKVIAAVTKRRLERAVERLSSFRDRVQILSQHYVEPWGKSSEGVDNFGGIPLEECLTLDVILLKMQLN